MCNVGSSMSKVKTTDLYLQFFVMLLVCGSFSDISARCFLEVQLNLAYRRHWDKSVVVLESKKSTNAAGSEVIRWVARFPFPLARREYIYARRWWLTTAGVGNQSFALIISRVGNAKPTDSAASVAMVAQNNDGGNGEEAQSAGGLVSVRSYESNMLIRSHGSIDEVCPWPVDMFYVCLH